MIKKIFKLTGVALALGFILSAVFHKYVTAKEGNISEPFATLWGYEFFIGVLVSGNVHQPSPTAMFLFVLLIFASLFLLFFWTIRFFWTKFLRRDKNNKPVVTKPPSVPGNH